VARYKKIKTKDCFGREFIYYKKLDDTKLPTRSKEYDRNGRGSKDIFKPIDDGSVRGQTRDGDEIDMSPVYVVR
jgi:hypothetical protein